MINRNDEVIPGLSLDFVIVPHNSTVDCNWLECGDSCKMITEEVLAMLRVIDLPSPQSRAMVTSLGKISFSQYLSGTGEAKHQE
jgi:hypothetical protein